MLLVVTTVFGLTMLGSAHAAPATPTQVEKKPYEYDFVANDDLMYNGFKGAKQLEIIFDKTVNPSFSKTEIKVIQLQGSVPVELPIINSIDLVGKKMAITFKNMELIDTTKGLEFQVNIPKQTLYYDQLTDFVFPFKMQDVLPGFKSVFADSNNAKLINTNIFNVNAPRDVYLHLPKMYLTKIETIHRATGSLVDKNPAMTNIDVLADEEAMRLKVKFNGDDQHNRDLDRHSEVKGFTMGQAGIDALVCQKPAEGIVDPCTVAANDFTLNAFDQYGRKLTQRAFKIKVNNSTSNTPSKNDIVMNNYISAPDKAFGQKKTLYEFLSDPKLSSVVLQQLPVAEYNRIGVEYKLSKTTVVNNLEQFKMALDNSQIHTIDMGGNTFAGDFTITKNLTLKNGAFSGNLTLGNNIDSKFRLDKVTVNNTLTVDAGANGSVVLDNTTVGNLVVLSGGINSIHLHNFTSVNEITMNNTSAVRIVNSYESSFGGSKVMKIKITSPQNIIVQGMADELQVNIDSGIVGQMDVKNGIVKVTETPGSLGTLHLNYDKEVNVTEVPTSWTISMNGSSQSGMTEVTDGSISMSSHSGEWSVGVTLPPEIRNYTTIEDYGPFEPRAITIEDGNTLKILESSTVSRGKIKLATVSGNQKFTIEVDITINDKLN